ncbi:hypothetical protein ACFQGE_06460 [Halomicroarcula sp. GCM10025817]|uniref:hypothetical protein n=1 Tax=Haloarcula TaxID=2237 RepID=UPI0023E88F32|nr:hypothetical protein [Halomicroarcula sp. SYNS111]
MTNTPPFDTPAESTSGRVRSVARAVRYGPVETAGFWTGVLAPLAYPLLLVGQVTTQSLGLLCAVVALNVCGLLLGRGYADRS